MNNIYLGLTLLHRYFQYLGRNLTRIDGMILSLLYLLHKMLIIHHRHDGHPHLNIILFYGILIVIVLLVLYHLYSKNHLLHIFLHDEAHLPNLLRYLHHRLVKHKQNRLNHHN